MPRLSPLEVRAYRTHGYTGPLSWEPHHQVVTAAVCRLLARAASRATEVDWHLSYGHVRAITRAPHLLTAVPDLLGPGAETRPSRSASAWWALAPTTLALYVGIGPTGMQPTPRPEPHVAPRRNDQTGALPGHCDAIFESRIRALGALGDPTDEQPGGRGRPSAPVLNSALPIRFLASLGWVAQR